MMPPIQLDSVTAKNGMLDLKRGQYIAADDVSTVEMPTPCAMPFQLCGQTAPGAAPCAIMTRI